MDISLDWINNNLLVIVAVVITLILIYQYLIERDHGVRLSKRYRNSIYEAQSKIFLNATQYLISGNRDLAIKEFLNAVDLNRETIDTYFALGGLFRSNGEIEKAIGIHRSLIVRENISESTRLQALKELAIDFDKGGFVDNAIETYKDVLKLNRDQFEVIQALCKIYEDIEDWDQAYNYRIMLSKVSRENQSETISHILVQKAKIYFERGEFSKCAEDLEDAFRFAPSVSAKLLKLKLHLVNGDLEDAKSLFLEILKEHPMYVSFIFESLNEKFKATDESVASYQELLKILQEYFLKLTDKDLLSFPSIILSKYRLLLEENKGEDAYLMLRDWIENNNNNENNNEVVIAEYVKLLIKMNKKDEAIIQVNELLKNLHHTLTKHFCSQCGFNSDSLFWRCPQCREWETIQFRWKV